jgi:hypothetical protein
MSVMRRSRSGLRLWAQRMRGDGLKCLFFLGNGHVSQ